MIQCQTGIKGQTKSESRKPMYNFSMIPQPELGLRPSMNSFLYHVSINLSFFKYWFIFWGHEFTVMRNVASLISIVLIQITNIRENKFEKVDKCKFLRAIIIKISYRVIKYRGGVHRPTAICLKNSLIRPIGRWPFGRFFLFYSWFRPEGL